MEIITEKLAELEHIQWETWTRAIAPELEHMLKTLDDNEPRAREAVIAGLHARLRRWKENWKPYSELPEDVKEHDRVWARKVLEII